jgi:hypothetical protein
MDGADLLWLNHHLDEPPQSEEVGAPKERFHRSPGSLSSVVAAINGNEPLLVAVAAKEAAAFAYSSLIASSMAVKTSCMVASVSSPMFETRNVVPLILP